MNLVSVVCSREWSGLVFSLGPWVVVGGECSLLSKREKT